jgi:hypothetical protein
LIGLFADGREEGLPDAGRLNGLGLGDGSVVFMLQRAGWCWTACGRQTALSEDGLVASINSDFSPAGWELVTGGSPMTEGRHYWEVELMHSGAIMIGVVRPGLNHDKGAQLSTGTYYIDGSDGGLCTLQCADKQGVLDDPSPDNKKLLLTESLVMAKIAQLVNLADFETATIKSIRKQLEEHFGQPLDKEVVKALVMQFLEQPAHDAKLRGAAFMKGDHIGVLLDLDAGWLRFYCNGERYGPGFTEGVTGPLKRAVQLHGGMGSQVAVVPSVEVPAGATDEQIRAFTVDASVVSATGPFRPLVDVSVVSALWLKIPI